MKIRSFDVLRDGPPFIIAEIGVNHDGSPKVGSELVDAAARARCDAVKFQLFRASMLLSREAGLVEYQKSAAGSAEELLAKLELPESEMADLVAQTHAHGIAAVVTPFSVALVAAAAKMGIDAIKLASPDLVNRPLIDEAVMTGLPLILSTGQATLEEVDRTLQWIGPAAERTAFLQCVSSYPTPPEHAALGGITAMRDRYPTIRVGYSDHTIETLTGALAVAAGACILEKHITLDKKRRGPDHAASMEPHEMTLYASQARQAFTCRGPVAKQPSRSNSRFVSSLRESICTTCDLPSGALLAPEMLAVKRPGTGIPAAELAATIGRKLAAALPANSILKPEHLL